MREIENVLYTIHLWIDDPAFRAEIDGWAAMTAKRDGREIFTKEVVNARQEICAGNKTENAANDSGLHWAWIRQ